MKNLFSSFFLGAILLFADFQASSWRYRRALDVGSAAVAVVNIDRTTYIHSQPGLADVRVANAQGEVPFVLETMSGSHNLVEVTKGVFDQGVTADGNLEVTIDVGDDQRHNGVRLSTGKRNFRQRVGVATSSDRRTWKRVRDDGYIFDFSQDDRDISVLDVSYPESSLRYVRLTVFGWKDPHAVTGCSATLMQSRQPVRDVMATLTPEAAPEAGEDARTQSTLYTWDLGIAGVPHDELDLTTATPEFQRAAVVESSQDGKQWSALGEGVLARYRHEQSLRLDFASSHDRYLRLRIYNRDDQPIVITSATLSVIRSRVKFKPKPGAAYSLYYGNADAHAPSYDLATLLAREAPSPETAVAPGREAPNPDFREKPPPAKPWSEQHPAILYVTLFIAVAGMGTVTIRLLRKANAQLP